MDENETDNDDFIFTNHLNRIEDVGFRPVGSWKDEDLVRITLPALLELRRAYNSMATAAYSHDFVITFACGGIPPFLFAARRESFARWGRRWPTSSEQHLALRTKYHLLPGLAWSCPNPEEPLAKLLCQLPVGAKVLVMDCSYTGGAIATAFAALHQIAATRPVRDLRLTLIGIVQRDKLDAKKLGALPASGSISGNGMSIEVRLEPVADLLFEDFPELIGYDSLQSLTNAVPVWSPGAIIVADPDTGLSYVRAATPVYTALDGLLEDMDWPAAGDLSVRAADVDAVAGAT